MILGNLAVFQAAIFPQKSFPCIANPDGSVNTDPSCEVTLPATRPDFAPSYRYHWAVCAQTVRELAHDSRSTTAPATNITACSTMIISARIQLLLWQRANLNQQLGRFQPPWLPTVRLVNFGNRTGGRLHPRLALPTTSSATARAASRAGLASAMHATSTTPLT